MTDCKVNYVDVIAHTGSVRSRVIIAEDTEAFQLADSNLCDIRNQVVRDSLRILADQMEFLRSRIPANSRLRLA